MKKKLTHEAARILGGMTSAAKARASARNGCKGGRPKGAKDSKPRKRSA